MITEKRLREMYLYYELGGFPDVLELIAEIRRQRKQIKKLKRKVECLKDAQFTSK